MRNLLFGLLVLFSVQASAQSYMILPIDSVYDGDTIKSTMNRLPKPLSRISIRIYGIDTPEKGWRAKCEKEKLLALQATNYLKFLIGKNKKMMIKNFKWGKYGGRIVGEVWINRVNIAQKMIDKRLAVPYYGKMKTKNWCN